MFFLLSDLDVSAQTKKGHKYRIESYEDVEVFNSALLASFVVHLRLAKANNFVVSIVATAKTSTLRVRIALGVVQSLAVALSQNHYQDHRR